MVDVDEFNRWRTEADRALEGAQAQAGLGRGPWGHDLDGLVESARDAGIEVSEELTSAAHRLGRHYIPARYPDAHASGSPGSHYGKSDWDQALRDSRSILQAVDRAWSSLG